MSQLGKSETLTSLEVGDWERETWEKLQNVLANEQAWGILRDAKQELIDEQTADADEVR